MAFFKYKGDSVNVVKIFPNPKVFWRDVGPWLLREEAKNCLILGVAYRFQTEPLDCQYQSVLFDGDRFGGAVIVSRYENKSSFLPSPVSDLRSAEKLFAKFLEANISVDGLVAEFRTANIYSRLFQEEGYKLSEIMRQGIYRCRKVSAPKSSETLSFRQANLDDLETLGQWTKWFREEALPNQSPIDDLALARGKIEKGLIYLAECNGAPVSMAAWSRDIKTSCAVNLVYTPKDYRGRGYASAVTAFLTQKLLNDGRKETNLFTDMSNPTSNKIYQSIGYKFVCDSVYLKIL